MTMSILNRTIGYCGVASLLGKGAANLLWDRVTPATVDMDHIGDQLAQEHRARERQAQDEKCATCREACD